MELGQFWREGGITYCFRSSCEKCKWVKACSWEEASLKIGPGTNIRRAFRSRPGWKIVSIDYKAIELRVAAQLSQEQVWIAAFREGRDLHSEMAKVAYKTDKPTKEQRDAAKAANFGNLYGGTARTLYRQSDLTLPEAVALHSTWWENLPAYRRWFDLQTMRAKNEGRVTTFYGRVRNVGHIIREIQKAQTQKERNRWESYLSNSASNSPIQGTSADILKIAMCRIQEWLLTNPDVQVKLLLNVHDELVFEIHLDDKFVDNCQKLSELMTFPNNQKNWDVPIETDIEVGDNWGELVSLEDFKKEYFPDVCSEPVTSEDKIKVVKQPSDVSEILLIVRSPLTAEQWGKLQKAVLISSEVPGQLNIPLYLEYLNQPQRERLPRKVSPGRLRKQVKLLDIPGVAIG